MVGILGYIFEFGQCGSTRCIVFHRQCYFTHLGRSGVERDSHGVGETVQVNVFGDLQIGSAA